MSLKEKEEILKRLRKEKADDDKEDKMDEEIRELKYRNNYAVKLYKIIKEKIKG